MHNVLALSTGQYALAGKMIAISIIQGGPAPRCFAASVADLMVYNEVKSGVDLTEIHNWDIQEKMTKVGSPVFAFLLSICIMNGVTPSVAEEGKIH